MTRPRIHPNKSALLLIALLVLLVTSGYEMAARKENSTEAARLANISPTVLWAWERPEQLSYLDPNKVTIAFLSQTLYLSGEDVVVRARLQPLEVSSEAPLISVTRIEVDKKNSPSLNTRQISDAAEAIVLTSRSSRILSVQIDFDATRSEREFYRDLISRVRAALPVTTGLTITALASWCEGDNWLDSLPIDEAVPMLFRMGVERNQFLSKLATGDRFRARKCQMSAGVSTDEPLQNLPEIRRLYVFSPKPWSKDAVERLLHR